MIGVAGDEHMRDGRLGRDAAGDQPCRCRRLHHHARTGPAGKLRSPRHHDPELRRDDVEPLGTILADHHHGGLTARAGRRLGRQINLDPWQMRGQLAATGPALGRAFLTQHGICPLGLRLDLGDRRFRVLEAELQLRLRQPLGLRAIVQAAQRPQQVLQPLGADRQRVALDGNCVTLGSNSITLDGDGIAFGHHRQHERAQRRGVGRQVLGGRCGGRHIAILGDRNRLGNPSRRLHARPVQPVE